MENIFKKFIYAVITLLVVYVLSVSLVFNDKNNALGLFIALLFFAVMYFINRKIDTIDLNDKTTNRIFLCIISVMLLLQIICGFALMVEPSWDFGEVYKEAIRLAEDPSAKLPNYFIRYPNNIALLYILTILYKLLNILNIKQYLAAGIILNILLINLSIIILYFSCKKMLGNKKAINFMILSMLFLPFYLYTPIFYTDTFSMPFIAGIVYFIAKYNETDCKKKKYLYMALMGILAAIGFNIKATVCIVLIAVVLYLIFKMINKKNLIIKSVSILIILVSFILGNEAWNLMVSRTIYVDKKISDEYKFPYEHWIMMGLKDKGFYDEDDVQYTIHSGNYNEKKEADIKEIKNRLSNYGLIGVAKNITKKTLFTWNSGTYFVQHCLKMYPINKNILHEFFTPKGKYYNTFIYYSYGYQIFIMLLLLLSIIKQFKNPQINIETIMHMSIAGIIVFFFIWENCPRYILNYMMLILLIDSDVLSYCKDYKKIMPNNY